MPVSRYRLAEILFYLALVLAVVWLFYEFSIRNTERIEHQNRVYAEDAADQIARRVDAEFRGAQDLVETYAYFLEHSTTKPEALAGMLKEMANNTPFDGIRFAMVDGENYSSEGASTDDRAREFFIRGMEGKSGLTVISGKKGLEETLLVFYSPLRRGDHILGVLQGTYVSSLYLRKMLETSYFNEPSHVFLCEPDGDVFASTADEKYTGNLLAALLQDNMIDPETEKRAREIFAKGGKGVFNCTPGCAIDNLCVMYLPHYNFVLVQAFPKKVTSTMIENANFSGARLEAGLFLIFALYVAFLLIKARRLKKRLERENRVQAWVIDAVNSLFSSRYCIADLETGDYEYISGHPPKNSGLKKVGKYEQLIEFLGNELATPEECEDFREFFAADALSRHLSVLNSASFECRMKYKEHPWSNLTAVCLERRDGRPIKILFVRQDVTEIKKRELQTRQKLATMDRKERQYRLAIQSNAFCSYEFNVSTDLVHDDIKIALNHKTISLLGLLGLSAPCKASELFSAVLPMIMPESRDVYRQKMNVNYLRKQMLGGRKEVELDFWWQPYPNQELCVRQSFYLTIDDFSENIMAMSVARDITPQVIEQRNQTRALQEALAMAQHANAAKTTFLSNMSHDIRTPMNAIIGYTTIAVGHLDNREQVRDCLQKVLSSSNHLLSLINDILDMSRIESGKLQVKEQECNISEIIHNLVSIIQPQTKAKQMHMFIDTFEVTNEYVITDPLKLNQIFINLLSNAVKYTPAGGAISFRLAQKTGFRHGYADYVFTVEDNGQGMSPEFIKHIFEPFTRESTTTLTGIQGTGLGMAITRNIVNLLGGTIEVESEPGKGSKFTVALPLKLHDKLPDENKIGTLKGMRTLIIDDDFHVCDSVNKMLKQLDFRPEWTTSGREAVYRAQIAHDERDPFQTYIIDWQMPDMNGLETTRQLRRIVGGDSPIIILTAYDWSDIEDEALQAGVTAFCAKPLFMSDLKSVLLSTHNLIEKEEAPAWDTEKFQNVRVLVVDDVEMNREIAEFALAESGFAVETATDGTDAVEKVRDSKEGYYNLILMDVQMPTMNGYEATRTIRSLAREDVKTMPIIAMTANAMEEDKAMALKAGMNAHIAKPLEMKSFFTIIRKFIK